MQVTLNEPTLARSSSPSFCEGRKFSEIEQAVLWRLLQQMPDCTSRDLLDQATAHQIWPRVTLRQINRWRAKWQRSRGKGRPPGTQAGRVSSGINPLVRVDPRLAFVGVHLFTLWLDQQNALEPVVAGLKEAVDAYRQTHPGEEFDLLHHRDTTLKRRFEALLLAPLLGIERLSAFDTKEHPLETLIGHGYQSSTLSQFLGQLERIDAGPWLMPILLPAQGGKLEVDPRHNLCRWPYDGLLESPIDAQR